MRHKPFPGGEDLVFHQECPICSSESITDLGTPVDHENTLLSYDRCDGCNLIFMNPRPTQDWYNHLYQAEFWEVKEKKKSRDTGQVRNQILKEAQWAEKFIDLLETVSFGVRTECPVILEIGCAYGLIAKLVAEHFSGQAFGVEPNDKARAVAQDVTGIEIFGNNMDELIQSDQSNMFDLIIFSHVLENITDPAVALKAAKRLLKPDGIILIDTPNNFVRKSWHIHHPYCFTKPALRCLLHSVGLDIQCSRSWSRPKYLFGPIYLSIIAGRSEVIPAGSEPSLQIKIKRFIGALQFNLFNRGPVAKINRLFAQRIWSPGEVSHKEIKRIIESL